MRGCCTCTTDRPPPRNARPTAAATPPLPITSPGNGARTAFRTAASGAGQSDAASHFHGARGARTRNSGCRPAASAKPSACACNPAKSSLRIHDVAAADMPRLFGVYHGPVNQWPARGDQGNLAAMDRDLIGYGAHPPDPKWPGGARLAVNFVLNYEEGSEPSVPDGDPASEWGLTENGMLNPGVKGRDLAAEGMFAYGSRVGFWRVMRLFAERNLPLTVFGCALALERHPPAAAAIRAAGHDVCCHGWRWEKHFELAEADERERIRRAVASLQQTMGERPLGWYCRYGPSLNTRRLLVEEGGFLYDSDAYDDELPYWTTRPGQAASGRALQPFDQRFEVRPRHLRHRRRFLQLLPRRVRLPLPGGRLAQPKMLSIGLHMRIIGHPARAAGLERLLDHVGRFPGVWVTRRIDIARHWAANHPPA